MSEMKRWLLWSLVALLAGGAGRAAAQAEHERLAVYAGAVVFDSPELDSLVLVEFPFSINRNELSFYLPDSNDTHLYARVYAQVDLLDAAGYAVDSARTLFSVTVASEQEQKLADYRIFNKLILMAPPGTYSARLLVIDAASKREGDFFFDRLEIPVIKRSGINIGGASLAYAIQYAGEDSPDYNPRMGRNGFNMIINPVSIFNETDTSMFLYCELYNLEPTPDKPSKYHVGLTVLDHYGASYRNLGAIVREKPGLSAVVAQQISLTGWETGEYKLQVTALDHANGSTDTVVIPFKIVSPMVLLAAANTQAMSSDPYDSLSLGDKVNLVKYLLTPEQLGILSGLSDIGKETFLQQYWREHDENPATTVIENRLETIGRYEYANRYFSGDVGANDGWSTDRGRIYIQYGPFDERNDYQAPRVGNAYEVWYYRSVKEGKLFVFEDWTGTQDYRLVHSNVYGEIYNQDWADKINQGYIDAVGE